MWFRRKRKKHEPTELASTLVASLLGAQEQEPESPEYSGLLLYSAAVGAVGAGVASWWLPGQVVEPALLGGVASVLPALGVYVGNRAHLCFDAWAKAVDGLEEKRHKRLQAELQARQATHEASRKRIEALAHLREIEATTARAIERGQQRASGEVQALKADYEQRRKWGGLLVAAYEGHSEERPRIWQGGQPFGKGKLIERFGRQEGERIYSALVAAEVVLPNGRQPQWNYSQVGHSPDRAERWLEAEGIL